MIEIQFKVGDIVKCIRDVKFSNEITKDKEYVVTNDSHNNVTFIINNYGKIDWYSTDRFEMCLIMKRNEIINEILE